MTNERAKTCRDFLSLVKARHGTRFDNELAELLGLTPAAVSSLQAGESTFSDATCLRVAELLGSWYTAEEIVAHAHRERARTPAERRLWENMAKKIAAVALGAVGLAAIATHDAAAAAHVIQSAIMLNLLWLAARYLVARPPLRRRDRAGSGRFDLLAAPA